MLCPAAPCLPCGFLALPYDRENPRESVPDSALPRLEEILGVLLEELSAAWQPQKVRCHSLERCRSSIDMRIAPYAERIGISQFLIQSERASRFLTLCYPKAVLEVLLPPLKAE